MRQSSPSQKTGRGRAACVAPTRAAAEAGLAMLRQGGNAFDAVVAAGFVEAVVQPAMCGIGGYAATAVGFLADRKELVALDANTVAPAAATPDMFPTAPTRDPNGYTLVDDRMRRGPLSVGVPGVLGGLVRAAESWGRLGLKAVMAPAIQWARDGIPLSSAHAKTWRALKAEADGTDSTASGNTIAMPMLAKVLETIAAEGAGLFYQGHIGQTIADFVQKRGGLLTRHDMAAYEAKVVRPLTITLQGDTLATPPPASGGLTALQVMALLDRLGAREKQPGTADWYHLFLETLKVVWEDRLTHLADAAFLDPAADHYVTDAHLDKLEARVREGLAHPSPGRLVAQDPLRGTSHIAAVDEPGNLVAWTQTHGGTFGSHLMVPGTEMVLGHGMSRFEPRPGWANSVAPGKRPLHNMCPTVALRQGEAILAAGAAGGRTIVNNTAALLFTILYQGQDPEPALALSRLQCETLEPASLERSAGQDAFEGLRQRGHQVKPVAQDGGKAHLLRRATNAWQAASEPRSPASWAAVLD